MSDATIMYLLLAAIVVVFILDRLPVAVVAIGAAVSLWATGILTVEEALARGEAGALLFGFRARFGRGARGADCGERPCRELPGVLEHLDRHAPVRHRDGPAGHGAERLAARNLIRAAIAVVDLEEELVGGDDRDEAVAGIESHAAEHPLRAQLRDARELIEHEIAELPGPAQRAKLDARAGHRYSRGTRAPASTVSLGKRRCRPWISFS